MPANSPQQLERHVSIVGAFQRGDDGQTFIFPLSSETPVWRYGQAEVLVHSAAACDLSFLNSGNAPLLDSHRRHEGLSAQIGVIKRAWLKDKRLWVETRFSQNARPQEIVTDVVDGIISNASVGYTVLKTEVSENPEEYRVIKWQPTEASLVSVPADVTVGIGRSAATARNTAMPETLPNPLAERLAEIADAVTEINALAASHSQRDLADKFVTKAMQVGEVPSLARFRGELRAAIPADTPLVNRNVGLTAKETKRFSLLDLGRGYLDPGAGAAERAMCSAAATLDPASARSGGLVVPPEVLNSWNDFEYDGQQMSNRSTAAAVRHAQMERVAVSTGIQTQLIFTEHLADRFIDNLRNASSILRAGVTVLAGLDSNVEIPGGNANITAAWLAAEAANAAETVPTFRKITLSIKDLAGYTDMTRRMMMQSSIDIEAYVRNQLTFSIVEQIDLAGLAGAGSGGVPQGIKGTAGISSVSYVAVGPAPTWAEIVAFETAVATANALRGMPVYIMPASMRGYLKSTEKATNTGMFLMQSNEAGLNGYPVITSNQCLSADMYFGNFADELMGMWGSLSLDRDISALFLSGGVRLRAIQSVDFAVQRVGSFCFGS